MSELTTTEKELIAAILAPEFSARHAKRFALPADHEALATENRCDLVLRADDGTVAQFEHTRPRGNPLEERIKPDQGGRVMEVLQECLNARGVRGAVVTITLDPPPQSKHEQEVLGAWLASFIVDKIERGRRTYFSLDLIDDLAHLRLIEKWLKRLVILPADPEAPAGVGLTTSRMAHIIDTPARVKEAIERKNAKCGAARGTVHLIVDCDLFPIDRLDFPDAVSVAASTPHRFGEIWAVQKFIGRERCLLLGPREEKTSIEGSTTTEANHGESL
jgi:hypothetical protein